MTRPGDPRSSSRRGDRGSSLVEFALVVPLFALLLFAIVDFGLVFGGYTTLRAGVESGARLASLDAYLLPAGSASCTPGAGVSQETADMVCVVASRIGTTLGTSASSLAIGIDFVTVNEVPSVEVCATAPIRSTTGVTAPFLDGRSLAATSTIAIEQGATYSSFASASSTVTYGQLVVHADTSCGTS